MNIHVWFSRATIMLGFTFMLAAEYGTAVYGNTNNGVLFSTGFEAAQGYDARYTLVGQNNWVGYGTGGNGLVTNYITGQGQQAFIGYAPPQNTNDTLNVWRPMVYLPDTNRTAHVEFSVWMAIIDSTNRNYDDFRWSIYNTNGQRLFTVDFDNSSLLVSYALDDTAGFVSTGVQYTNNFLYTLTVDMDFNRNTWSARLDGQLLTSGKRITTKGAALNLGDVDAVWAIRTPGSPGNNYMIFDNYQILLKNNPTSPMAPLLVADGRLVDGRFIMHLLGAANTSYALEASTNMVNWFSLQTNSTGGDGSVIFIDGTAPSYKLSYYRARWTGQ